MTIKRKYTRAELIALAEQAVKVPVERWSDRDTPRSIERAGVAFAFLSAGCEYRLADEPRTDARTVWIEITHPNFGTFDYDADARDCELFYLPTQKRLDETAGGDWY